MKRVRFLAAKTALAAVLVGSIITSTHAGIPVIDGGNLTQNVMTAIESVAQTLKQIEQYQTQLQQYENMLQNTVVPAAYIWDQAQATMSRLIEAQSTLAHYQNQLGSLDSYLAKFQDVAYYRSSPCFNCSGGCTEVERAAMDENRRLPSESQKKANDAGCGTGRTRSAPSHWVRQPARQSTGQPAFSNSHHAHCPAKCRCSADCG